jgi:Flp pilus assembly pilin Flp
VSNPQGKPKAFIDKVGNKVGAYWVSYSFLICIFFSLVVCTLFYFGLLTNVKSIMGYAVSFASIVIGVMGVFLSLLITLAESDVFKRIRTFFPTIETKLYRSFRSQINYALLVVLISIAITGASTFSNKWLAMIGLFIWSVFFLLMTFGTFYSVKLVTDLVTSNHNASKEAEGALEDSPSAKTT